MQLVAAYGCTLQLSCDKVVRQNISVTSVCFFCTVITKQAAISVTLWLKLDRVVVTGVCVSDSYLDSSEV